MDFFLKILSILAVVILSACSIAPTRQELLEQKIIYSRNSDKNYLEIAACLRSDAGFYLPKDNRNTWRDINTFFIYHESVAVHGYPQMHDEAGKTYYITEIHDPKYFGSTKQPMTHGNGDWIMIIRDASSGEHAQSTIEIRSNKNLLSDYPPDTYTPGPDAPLSQRLYKVEKIDQCF
ncbi:MAG: hypothetical protein E6Q62_03765 [Nitrosomonas sp.]|nr:MAG: hypothetical protein E6Q62_03765 [Nitrosomonas sp.]